MKIDFDPGEHQLPQEALHKVDGDGNCYWRAAAHSLASSWRFLKADIIKAIPNQQRLRSIYKEEVISHQVSECAQPNAWANELMIVATAEHLQKRMIVYDCHGTVYVFGAIFDKQSTVYLHYNGVHYDAIQGRQAQQQLEAWLDRQTQTHLYQGGCIALQGGSHDRSAINMHEEYEQHWLDGCEQQDVLPQSDMVLVSNLTSMRAHVDKLLAYQPNIAFIAETKLPHEAVVTMQRQLESQGYACVACSAPFKGNTQSQHAGVALLARHPYRLAVHAERELPSGMMEWVHQGCFIGADLLDQDGRKIFALGAVYAPVDTKASSEKSKKTTELCNLLCEWAHMQGALPTMIGGDFNLQETELQGFDALLHSSDLQDIHAVLEQYPRRPTTARAGKAIDYLLLNQAARARALEAWTVEGALIPVHKPLACRIKFEDISPKMRLNNPRPIELKHKPAEQEGNNWQVGYEEYAAQLEARNLTKALLAWSARWESFLRYQATSQGYRVDNRQLGRGELATWHPTMTQPKTSSLHKSYDSVLVKQLTKSLNTAAYLVQHPHYPSGESYLQYLNEAVKRLQLPHWDSVTWADLPDLCTDMQTTIIAVKATEKQRRIQAWKSQFGPQQDPTGRKGARFVKAETRNPLTGILPTGCEKPITEIAEMDALAIEYWANIAPEVQKPMNEIDEYLDKLCPQAPAKHLDTIRDVDVQFAWKHAKPRTSTGAGAWSAEMLRNLPLAAAAEMAALYNAMEEQGYTPPELRNAFVTLIPKAPGPVQVHQTRPIAVTPTLMRTWSAIRSQQMGMQLKDYFSAQQHGGLCGKNAQRPLAEFFAQIASNEFEGHQTYGLQVDFAKFFDSIDIHCVAKILTRAGYPPRTIDFFVKHYSTTGRRFRFPQNRVGAWWRPAKGLMQGDSLSVTFANLFALPLANALAQLASEEEGVWYAQYVDDVIITTTSLRVLEMAAKCVEEFAEHMGVRINPTKSVCFATDPTEEPYVALAGVQVPVQHYVKYLGVHCAMNPKGATAVKEAHNSNWEHVNSRLRRVGCLPADPTYRSRIAAMSPLSKWSYDIADIHFDARAITGQRRVTMKAVRGDRSLGPAVAPEIMLSHLYMGHRLDPPLTQGMNIVKFTRMMYQLLPHYDFFSWEWIPTAGPLSALTSFCKWAGIQLELPKLVVGDYSLDLLELPQDNRQWLHKCRHLLRLSQARKVAERRQMTFGDAINGISRSHSFQWVQKETRPRVKGLLADQHRSTPYRRQARKVWDETLTGVRKLWLT